MWNYWCCMKKKLLETGKHKSIRRNFWNTFLVLDIHHATVFTNKTVCGSLFVTSDLPVLLYITWQMVSHKGPSGKTSQKLFGEALSKNTWQAMEQKSEDIFSVHLFFFEWNWTDATAAPQRSTIGLVQPQSVQSAEGSVTEPTPPDSWTHPQHSNIKYSVSCTA